MDKDEIIVLARQAGLPEAWISNTGVLKWSDLESFAKLVAAKHNPKIAIADAYRAGVDSGIAAEREACAKVCETARETIWEYHEEHLKASACNVCTNIAISIRARS